MVIKGIVCIILCQAFLRKNMAYYYSNDFYLQFYFSIF